MPSVAELLRSIDGAFRLFLFDPRGLEDFDQTVAGFWRSFFAAFLLAPVYLWLSVVQHDLARAFSAIDTEGEAAIMPALATTLVADAIAYPIYWAVFPLAMIPLARLLDITARYVPFITVYNWSSVVAVGVQLVPFVLYRVGLLTAENVAAPIFAALVIASVYRWFIARVALGIGGFGALGLVFIDLLLALFIARLTDVALQFAGGG